MAKFETVAVPFQLMGNRQVLTATQVVEQPWLGDFIERFPACFQADPVRGIWLYYPDGDAPHSQPIPAISV